jgi:hypothetical protein
MPLYNVIVAENFQIEPWSKPMSYHNDKGLTKKINVKMFFSIPWRFVLRLKKKDLVKKI